TGLYETLSVTMHFIITIVLSWGGYRVFSPRRNNVSHGDAHLLSDEGRDVLLFVDNIYRYTLAGTEVSALLGRMPSAVGYQPTLA
ncbi:hypothetical protein MJI47_27490, partial [Salmonella enterica subsp. enterica serovar Kentucky]|nr:hypothetical protein [Salmonella enterica subsp. enterica serovar Kentucky]